MGTARRSISGIGVAGVVHADVADFGLLQERPPHPITEPGIVHRLVRVRGRAEDPRGHRRTVDDGLGLTDRMELAQAGRQGGGNVDGSQLAALGRVHDQAMVPEGDGAPQVDQMPRPVDVLPAPAEHLAFAHSGVEEHPDSQRSLSLD